ncbi:hypothetical protein TKK_0000119 [Trichogramma kaykai]
MDSFTPEQLELQQELDALNEVMKRNLLETPMSEEDWTTLTERTTDLTIHDGVAYSRAHLHGRADFLRSPPPTTTRMERVAKTKGI